MAQPTRYDPAYDFSDYQTTHPTDPLPGDKVDVELAALQATTDDICDNLALIQRDDGALANGIVTPDSLSTSSRALVAASGNPRGGWVTATAYAVGDVVSSGGATYICCTAHTSGTFATDLAAVKWLLLSVGADTGDTAYCERFSGTGAQTVFTTSQNFGTDEKALMLFVAGVFQDPLSAYTISGTTLTFVSAPASGSNNIVLLAPSTQMVAALAAAVAAKDDAETAQAAAESAQADAETALAATIVARDAALTAETNAETAETNAEASATAAANSAAAAAAAVGSKLFNTIADKSGDYTVVADTDDGTLFKVDSSSGNVALTLPSIATALEGERYGIYRTSASNTVTLVRNGSDTINGVAGTYTLPAVAGELTVIVADDATPDNWVVFTWTQAQAGSGLSKSGSTISLDVANPNTWTGPQRASVLTDNDGSFDMSAKNDFVCTPTGAVGLTFTNLASGQRGMVFLVNPSAYAITFNSIIKKDANAAAVLSAAGSYMISYWCYDGSNVAISYSSALS